MPFELGRIEGALAGQLFPAIFLGGEAGADHRVAQLGLGLVPHLFGAEAIVGAQRQLDRVSEAEVAIDAVGKLAECAHLIDDLVLAAEDMRVVLGELADAHQPVQRAVRLVAVAAAVFVQPERQVAIRFDPLAEDQDVRRAVHRLERHPLRVVRDDRALVLDVRHFVGDDEHVLAIFAPMAGLLPLARVHHLRRLHFAIARGVDRAAHIGLEFAPDGEAVRMPEHDAMRFGLEVEQVHLLAQLAVVALGRLLKPHQMLVELLLVEPASAVDARKHRVLLVAAPIGARDARQLERIGIDLAGGGQVRAAAHVEPRVVALAGAVDGQFLAFGKLLRPFGLEGLALLLPALDQLLAAPDFADQRFVRRDDLAHLGFDRGQVLLGEGAILGREVVIEAVVGRWAKGDLRAGKQLLHRLGEDVRVIVARELERILLVARRDERELRIAFERTADVAQFAVDARGERGLGEPRTDRRGDVRRGSPRGYLTDGTVGQRDTEHLGHGWGTFNKGLILGARLMPAQARYRQGGRQPQKSAIV